MANMQDYLVWRGEFSFEITPWNEIDALLTATLCYLNFHGVKSTQGWTLEEAKRIGLLQEAEGSTFPARKNTFEAMADSPRFRDCRMHHFIALTDPEREMQFAAMCMDMPDGSLCVMYRGTDNTVVGWKEDFNMAYRTRVPAQEAAAWYLARVAEVTEKDRPLRLTGHSKGGNLAVYAAAMMPAEIQDRIEGVWSFDGPGMNRETSVSEGYARIREKLHSYDLAGLQPALRNAGKGGPDGGGGMRNAARVAAEQHTRAARRVCGNDVSDGGYNQGHPHQRSDE